MTTLAQLTPLSGLDSSFLYLETDNIPMHIGGLDVCDGSLTFDEFREFIASRLHLAPRLLQRLVQAPFNVDYPYWVDDPDFDIDMHLHHTALPGPGGWRELRRLASRLYSQPLHRSRPLWEMVFVEGLNTIDQVPHGSVAVISKIHHAAIDGASGAEILGLLFDVTPEGRKLDPPADRELPPIPGKTELFVRSATRMLARPRMLPELLLEAAKSTLKTGRLTRVQGEDAPVAPFSAPRTILNQPVSPQRVWDTALLSLDRVKRLRKSVRGATVNDVVLAISAGALRTYLGDRNELPDEPLVAMVPVSTRSEDARQAMGNQVSMMLVQLPTNVDDPLERLRVVTKNTTKAKSYDGAVAATRLSDFAEFVPFALAGRAARIYTRVGGSRHHAPVFNVVITNVPGPQIPLYLAGKKLLAHMGMAPIFDGIGLVIPVFSYNGVLSISPTSAANIIPDVNVLARRIRESANDLEAAIEHLDDGRCQATTRAGSRCKRMATAGATHCSTHGGQPAARSGAGR